MAQLNVVVRTLIRIAFGTALPSGNHADALESYKQATRLSPERLIHRFAHCTWSLSLSNFIVANYDALSP